MMSMYAADDIRSTLQATAPTTTVDPSTPIRSAQLVEFRGQEPSEITALGSRTWHVRSTNAVLTYTDAKAGDVFRRDGHPDEYTVLMFSESAPVRVTAGDEQLSVDDEALLVVPPGDSAIEVLADGALILLSTVRSAPLRASAVNAASYDEPDIRVAPLGAGAEPADGYRLRVYRLADAPLSEDRFGRIYRTGDLMINFVPEETAPRDPQRLSPHFHDDFEQLSLAVKGTFVHHIRYPWGPDSTQWKADEALETDAPSVCIIPPPTVHTTRGIGAHQQLIDIFAPPRADFAASGWVLNADDYPVP